jgi:hypothetical protein
LLPDPACGSDLLPRLEGQAVSGNILPLLFDYVQRGLLPRPTARALIAAMGWQDFLHGLNRFHQRNPVQAAQVLAAAASAEAVERLRTEKSRDVLDAILDLFWAPPEDAATPSPDTETFFDKLTGGLLALEAAQVQRLIAALLTAAARHGSWQPRAAELCVVFHPGMLVYRWIPRDVRYRAVQGFYALGTRCPRRPDEFVRSLLNEEVCRRPSGALDLWVIGGLLHLVDKNPYQKLQLWVGPNRITAAFLEDMEHAAPFFCLTDDSEQGRQYLIHEIGRQRRPRRAFFHALLAHAVTADGLDFLTAVDGDGAVQVFTELLRLADRRGMSLSENKSHCLAAVLGPKIAAAAVDGFLHHWLERPAPEEFDLGLRILGVLARTLDGAKLVQAAHALELPALKKFLTATAWCAGFPYGKEVQLARVLTHHADEEVRAWARLRVTIGKSVAPPPQRLGSPTVATLSETDRWQLSHCGEGGLHRELVLKGCLRRPMLGLCEALAGRPALDRPSVEACAALLASHDSVEEVAEQFARFGSDDAAFLELLEREVVKTWLAEQRLPLLGHAWLYRWEEHNFAFYAQLLGHWKDGLPAALAFARGLAARPLARRLWEAVTLLLGIWRWRDKPAFRAVCTELLGAVLIEALTSLVGELAASILVLLHEGSAAPGLLADWKARVALRLPELRGTVRGILHPWIDSTGLVGAPVARRPVAPPAPATVIAQVRASADLNQLEAWCCLHDARIVEEAALRLLELGEEGTARLLALLRRVPLPPMAATLAVTISLWPDGPALNDLRAFVADAVQEPELRFLAGIGLLKRGERGALDAVLAAACVETKPPWFLPEHWQELVNLGIPDRTLALSLAVSAQPHAYTRAVPQLVCHGGPDEEAHQALRAFLEAGNRRARTLRVRAAAWLHTQDDFTGFPILLENECNLNQPRTPNLLRNADADLVEATVTAVLVAGPRVLLEKDLFAMLNWGGVDPEAQADAYARLLSDAAADTTRAGALARLKPTRSRAHKLRRVAEAFAWGVQQARILTGKLFIVEMIAGEQLGYTRLNQNKVFINPLPILRGEPHGRDTVQALILHELGHHLYHRGETQEQVWKDAETRGLARLLNLVADEHLERNLRAGDEEFGNKLKRLAAHAFQHAEREVPVETLLDGLQGQAFAVLTTTRLGAARRMGRVVVESGQILLEMERAGLSFARFFRALRMGLGNRHHDPRVAEGLALFRGRFRQSSMERLLDLAQRLRDIFGWETQLLQSFSQDECQRGEPGDLLADSEGITNSEIQSEVERVLNPENRPKPARQGKPSGRLWINVADNERFATIPTVEHIDFDPVQHAVYARQVARPARNMRRYLIKLGLALLPQRMRLRGRSLDRTRLPALVTRRDPRLLIAREHQVRTDLFLGVVIDCSGSMQVGQNIEKAKLFGVLLAEAARGLPGIDVRLFGFTDRVIYDAGHAARCAVHGLVANGGNNDAAGLWHAAQAALASHRKAKLLVMVSDGLPTECSVAALRGLVQRLGRRFKICCAQVAVRRLEEVCFPHYVLLEENDVDASVRRFGGVVARLVWKAMHGG